MRSRWLAFSAGAIVLGIVLVLLRGEPWIGGDPGVFLSVAGRLLEGDRLYADVFDNKDPLFYFTYAGALWLGGWRGPFMLDAVWLAVASVSMALLIRELRAPQSAVIAGFLVYPLALTAGWYLVSMSMLGALAVAPLAPWLWLRRRFAAAGVVLLVVMLLKMNAAPLAAAPLVALLVLGAPGGRRRRALRDGALGVGGAGLAAVAFLAIRGELRPYLDTILYNIHYASARTPSDTAVGQAVDHLRVAWDFFYLAGRWQVPTAILVLTVFGVVLCVAAIRRARSEYILGGAAIAALAGAFLVVALTAYGYEHLQLLAYPATLVVGTLIWRVDAAFGRRAGAIAATAFVLFALWSSLKAPGGTGISRGWTTDVRPITGAAFALERARERFRPDSRPVTYMVFGSNSENGHASFLADQFHLTCRYFHLYHFSRREQFDETLDCARRARPEFILVTLGFNDPPVAFPEWNAFVSSAKQILHKRYELVETENPGFEVWRRQSA